jgi:hypothetical protein
MDAWQLECCGDPFRVGVLSIQAVTHQVTPRPGEDPRTYYPVPGTAVLTEVEESAPWFESGGLTFAGYLIDLDN